MLHPSHSSLIFQIFTSGLDKNIAKSSKRLRIFKNASDCAKSCAGQPKTISRYSCLKQEENYIWPKSYLFFATKYKRYLIIKIITSNHKIIIKKQSWRAKTFTSERKKCLSSYAKKCVTSLSTFCSIQSSPSTTNVANVTSDHEHKQEEEKLKN
jgi:hypothetical protein